MLEYFIFINLFIESLFMKYIAIVALVFGLILFSGCTQQAPTGGASNTTLINTTCSDGTLEKTCSMNKPYYCAGGELIKSVEKCGCPANQTLSNGVCVKLCSDGTESGKCGLAKPNYCLDGTFISDPAKCGCNDSRYDLVDNSCVIKRCSDGTEINDCSDANSTLLCAADGTLSSNPAECGCEDGYSLSNGSCLKDCSDGTKEGKCSTKDATKFCMNGTLATNTEKCSCPSGKISCNGSCIAPNCTVDSVCYDGNQYTIDKCLSPGMCNATCSNEYATSVIYDVDETPEMHDLEFTIDSFDNIGRNWSYTSKNGTDYVLTSSSSSKEFIEVSVSIEAKDDYDFEVSQDSFYLIDDENIKYDPVCASKYNKTSTSTSSCYNDNAFESYDSLSDGDVVEGYLYFEIPRSNDPQYFAFVFDDSLKPGEIWFRYD
jgi:hypothetical protein